MSTSLALEKYKSKSWDTTSHSLRWLKLKKQIKVLTRIWRIEPWHVTGRNVRWCSCFGKQFDNSSEVKHRGSTWHSNFTLRYMPTRNENMSTQTFTAALFIITVKEKWLKCPCVIFMQWNTILTIKRIEIDIHSTTWCWVKEAYLKWPQALWFQLYKMSKNRQIWS